MARCTAVTRAGQQCTNRALDGIGFCGLHSARKARRKRESDGKSVVLEQMRRARVPMPNEDDIEVSSAAMLLRTEIRRTVGWIRFCESKIDGLPTDESLVWGMNSQEVASGVKEDKAVDYTSTTSTADRSTWLSILEWNREHLAKLNKIWIDAGFEQARLILEERALDRFSDVISAILYDVGIDASDMSVRQTIHSRLVSMADRLEVLA